MRAYENVMFSFYCDNIFFKKGLIEILDEARKEVGENIHHRKSELISKGSQDDDTYDWIDIVALSSKSISEKLPRRERLFDDERTGVIVFCTEKMMHVIKGLEGYENAIFISIDRGVDEVKSIFKNILSSRADSRRSMFRGTVLSKLTDREKLVTRLFKEEMSQQEISRVTKMTVKVVSHHLRSDMTKYHVNTLMEYRVKLNYVIEMKYAKLND